MRYNLLAVAGLLVCAAAGLAATRDKVAAPSKNVLKSKVTVLPPTLAAQAAPRTPTALDRVAPYRRCLWVSRWEYTREEDVVRICYNAASARFTDLIFQVRGAGSVGYASAREPWMPQLGSGGGNPGWDPLATCLREAKKYGLRVHAYMNVLPACAGSETDTPLYKNHRNWFMVDADGRTMRTGGWYAFLDPGLPEVREYLAALFAEVAAKYAVDGIHLDYIRYPEEKGDYSYHPRVVKDFRDLYGGSPSSRPDEWGAYRRKQVTATVQAIAAAVRKARPGIEVTASVVADQQKAYARACQPALEWVRGGVVDAVAPMAYSGDLDHFAALCAPFREEAVRGKVWLGVWAEPKRNDYFEEELRRAIGAKFAGISVFSYENLFPNHKSSSRARGAYQAFTSRQVSMK